MASGTARKAGGRLANLLYGSIGSSSASSATAPAASWASTGLLAGYALCSVAFVSGSVASYPFGGCLHFSFWRSSEFWTGAKFRSDFCPRDEVLGEVFRRLPTDLFGRPRAPWIELLALHHLLRFFLLWCAERSRRSALDRSPAKLVSAHFFLYAIPLPALRSFRGTQWHDLLDDNMRLSA